MSGLQPLNWILRKARRGERAKRASLFEDRHSRNEVREMAKDIMAISTTKLTHPIPFGSLHSYRSSFIKYVPRFARRSVVRITKEKLKVAKRSMTKFVNMWQHKALHTTFISWSSFAKKSITDKIVLSRFVKKMMNRSLHVTFLSWNQYTMSERRNKFIFKKFASRMKNQQITKSLESWKSFTLKRKLAKQSERTNEQKVSGVLARMLKATMVRTFFAWKDDTAETIKNRHIVAKFVNRMRMGGVMKSIAKWRELVAMRVRMRKFINKMIGGKYTKSLFAAMNTWKLWNSNFSSNNLERAVVELEDIVNGQQTKMKLQMKQIAELEEHIRNTFGVQQVSERSERAEP